MTHAFGMRKVRTQTLMTSQNGRPDSDLYVVVDVILIHWYKLVYSSTRGF
jgi:hypothetical protein